MGFVYDLGMGKGSASIIILSTCIRERDIVIAPLVIPSTCICGRDIVVTLLVCVCVCVST